MPQYSVTPERAAVLQRHPDYAVDIAPAPGVMQARVGDRVLARSARALRVDESFHAPVIYFPPEDVDFEQLVPSDHRTRCPFKGDAAYYHVLGDAEPLRDAVWSYPDPMPEVAALVGHLAFYVDRVTVEPG